MDRLAGVAMLTSFLFIFRISHLRAIHQNFCDMIAFAVDQCFEFHAPSFLNLICVGWYVEKCNGFG